MTPLPGELLKLLNRPSLCFIATTMPDGSPQLTQTWVDTDGEHILINTVEGYRKTKNVQRDPRVAVSIADPDDTSRYFSVRGRVTSTTADGAAESIEQLAQKYTGHPYASYGGPGQTRLLLTITVDSVIHSPMH
ncbi:PPOX class F420-dependent oxidoreductase [Streptomyces phaeochromogenes]|uniref:PPOX class F420-dependent oxidoreductase n=1 Tax=Streptomyces phaeochromogenes TaxID=1923 RepID=UPI002E2B041E|nr:PPOX class F420-dependent oxidoreductase [Streptomyces phaeochromogenes]